MKNELEVKMVSIYDTDYMYDGNIDLKEFPYGYVTEGLREFLPEWNSKTPIAIFAPMGTGKNTFVENVIIPYASQKNENVLLVCNRVALNRQSKRRLLKLFDLEYLLDGYSDSGVDSYLIKFGNLMVVSYQQLASWINEKSYQLAELEKMKFGYAIFDEAHFFMSDSGFNAFTDFILDHIIKCYSSSVRIYMTATPKEVFPILKEKEKKLWATGEAKHLGLGPWIYPGRYPYQYHHFDWQVYKFEYNFSYINAYSFDDMDDLVEAIQNSHDKWVVFVESITNGQYLCDKIEDAILVTADSRNPKNKSYETFKKITDEEKFEERVLISTAVLENGINIKDCRVKNVAIFSNNEVRFLQMLGRVRRIENNMLNVYIPNETEAEVNDQINNILRTNKACDTFYASPTSFYDLYISNQEPWARVKQCTTILKNQTAHLNQLFPLKINYFDLKFWQEIKSQYESGDEFPVLKAKLGWIRKQHSECCQVGKQRTADAMVDVIFFLDKYLGKEVVKDQQKDFCRELSELFKKAYGKRKKDKGDNQMYGLKIIKELLSLHKLPYIISNQDRHFWKISKEELKNE